jgi:hypothetical protein
MRQLFCRRTGAGLTGGVDASGGGHPNVIDVSRSSSSGQDSPTKPDRRRRVSIYFNNKKGDILQKKKKDPLCHRATWRNVRKAEGIQHACPLTEEGVVEAQRRIYPSNTNSYAKIGGYNETKSIFEVTHLNRIITRNTADIN